MKQILDSALLLMIGALPGPAKDSGGLLPTGSLSVIELNDNGGGSPTVYRSTTTNFFNKHGDLTKTVTLSDLDENGIPATTSTNTLFYGERNHLVYSTLDFDARADGTVDRRSIVIYTNFIGNPRRLLTLVDQNADGIIDEILAGTYTFDRDGRLIRLVTEIDTNADGTVDFQSAESWAYDLEHHQLFYSNESDLYSPGVPAVVSTAVYTLNKDGDPLAGTWSRYDPLLGAQLASTIKFTYDRFGNLVRETRETELPGPSGLTKPTTTVSYFYARRGQAIRDVPVQRPALVRAP